MEEAIHKLVLEAATRAKEGKGPAVVTRKEIDQAVTAALNNLNQKRKIRIGICKKETWIKAREEE